MAEERRVCLFTGVSGRLGRDFCRRYAGTYDIVGVYHSTVPEVPVHRLGDPGGPPPEGIYGVRADLGADGAPEKLVRRVLSRFASVDLLVNAAVYRRFAPVRDKAFALSLDWQLYFNVAVPTRIVSALTRRAWEATPDANRTRNRNVVNLSSTAASILYPGSGQGGYGASKAALEVLTRHLASELSDIGIRANALAPNTFPGLVATEAVSDAVVALDAGAMTGRTLLLDVGGAQWSPAGEGAPTSP